MGRITWTDENSRKLITILINEKERGASKNNWPNIAKIFNVQTGLNVSGTQVRNHHTDLKEKYKCWEDLQGLTGISYNPTTKVIDVEERSLERYNAFLEKNPKYGIVVAKKDLPNRKLLTELFSGKTAHGVGGCFSPAMGRGASYLGGGVNEELNTEEDNEGFNNKEDAEEDTEEYQTISVDEDKSPPRSTSRKSNQNSCLKRKSEEDIDSIELKRRQTSFDSVIQLLSRVGVGSSSDRSKAQVISDELTRMGVTEERGDEYFVSAMRYLSEEKHADTFMALTNDKQKRIYLKGLDVDD